MVDFERIYGDRASLLPAILACISLPNKVPLERSQHLCALLETVVARYWTPFGYPRKAP